MARLKSLVHGNQNLTSAVAVCKKSLNMDEGFTRNLLSVTQIDVTFCALNFLSFGAGLRLLLQNVRGLTLCWTQCCNTNFYAEKAAHNDREASGDLFLFLIAVRNISTVWRI